MLVVVGGSVLREPEYKAGYYYAPARWHASAHSVI